MSKEGGLRPDIKTPEAHHILSIFDCDWQLRKVLLSSDPEADHLMVLIDEIRERWGALFIGKEQEFERFLEKLKQITFSDKEQLLHIVSEKLSALAHQLFSLEELEKRARSPEYRGDNKIFLSEIMDCNINQQDASLLRLHIKPSTTMSLGEQLKELRAGLKKLGQKLISDQRFAKIKTITGTSWIMAKRPILAEQYGFHLEEETEYDRLRGVRYVTINREDFLTRYGTKG